jgi:hypothetical protein
MLTMDVFNQNAFSAVSMLTLVDRLGYVPGFLGAVPGLFDPQPVTTEMVWIEERANAPALIQTSLRGEPPKQKGNELRAVRAFRTLRLAQGSRIMASQLQGIRAAGSETELQTLESELARRQLLNRRDLELTLENMRLGCVQGLVTDADGSTIYDWATEFGQTIPAEVDFDLDNPAPTSGAVRIKCNQVKRGMLRALNGLGGNAVAIMAIAGDTFWDLLTAHTEVRQTYLNTQEAASLRQGNVWESFSYGGITWTNYRGTDDGTTVGVNTNLAKFFPINAGIFQIAWAPGESFEFVNTMGRPVYPGVVLDRDRNSYADIELYSYPLPVCTLPQALARAKAT